MKDTRYSFEDVKIHNNENSCWVVLANSVYDVTPFLNEHPGGADILLENAGIEVTDQFFEVGHSTKAIMLLGKYKIGELIDEDMEKRRLRRAEKLKRQKEEEEKKNRKIEKILKVIDSTYVQVCCGIALGLTVTVLFHLYSKK
ncbi:unnamed protein product [Acanthoscelides obtectus]|uniref:Cytochrome b5 heme-binding domain-containing protein n=1 Tax=Acanthoscelides obtectus TaxID=200917 RepID=A0A9P0JVW0_ACAOB|nr:unnamed protein product [Acanthoscelides obtectus]CAK1679279.1 Cytochrome b5 isoform A [Acanthoscelides obtectus]